MLTILIPLVAFFITDDGDSEEDVVPGFDMELIDSIFTLSWLIVIAFVGLFLMVKFKVSYGPKKRNK